MTPIESKRAIMAGQRIRRATRQAQGQPVIAPRGRLVGCEFHDLLVTRDRLRDSVLQLQAIRQVLPAFMQVGLGDNRVTKMRLSFRVPLQSQQRESEPHLAGGIAPVDAVGAAQQFRRFGQTPLLISDQP